MPLTPQPRTVFFQEIQLAPSAEDPKRLVFVAAQGAPPLPDELMLLRQAYQRTARVVSVLFENERNIRKEMFDSLHECADRGFRGPEFSIEDGRANLAEMRETIVDFAHKVRDQRLRDYTRLLLFFGVAPLIA